MKTAGFILGGTMIALGLMAIAGSAGDCDGRCVENANTISEMLMFAGIGLTMFITGSAVLISNRGEA